MIHLQIVLRHSTQSPTKIDHNGKINTLSRNFFNWSCSSVAFSNSRFLTACSISFSSRLSSFDTSFSLIARYFACLSLQGGGDGVHPQHQPPPTSTPTPSQPPPTRGGDGNIFDPFNANDPGFCCAGRDTRRSCRRDAQNAPRPPACRLRRGTVRWLRRRARTCVPAWLRAGATA